MEWTTAVTPLLNLKSTEALLFRIQKKRWPDHDGTQRETQARECFA